MIRPMTRHQFDTAMQIGADGSFTVRTQPRMKEYLAIAVRSHIASYVTQQEAADGLGCSQPTISDIVRGDLSRVKSSYLLDMLFKAGVVIEVTIRA
jgi:predicted XRE-type DNA-binding protein